MGIKSHDESTPWVDRTTNKIARLKVIYPLVCQGTLPRLRRLRMMTSELWNSIDGYQINFE